MTRTLTLVLATAAALAAVLHTTQMAHATCSGDACNAVTFDGTNITNNDPQLKAKISGCFIDKGTTCSSPPVNFSYTIEPKGSIRVMGSARQIIKWDLQSATLIGTRPILGPNLMEKISVTNSGDVPLKVVILDTGFIDIGRTPDYKTGTFEITLRHGVAKYHWEVFTPGAVEPCDKLRNVSESSIKVHCQRPKAPDAAHMPITMPVTETSGTKWAEKCKPGGFAGAATCCAKLRQAEPYCMQQPPLPGSAAECGAAEELCKTTARTWAGHRDGGVQ
jgi:hypothetical protein